MFRLGSKYRLFLATLAFCLVWSNISCSTNVNKRKGEEFVESFHDLFNEGQYQRIYEAFDEPYKKTVTGTQNNAFFATLRQRLGIVKESKQIGWQVYSSADGTRVSLQYGTSFSNGSGDEQFVLFVKDNKITLLNYDVQSPLLTAE